MTFDPNKPYHVEGRKEVIYWVQDGKYYHPSKNHAEIEIQRPVPSGYWRCYICGEVMFNTREMTHRKIHREKKPK